MQNIKIICDICEKECQSGAGNGNFVGVIARLTTELVKRPYKFGYDLCTPCTELLLNFVDEMKVDKPASKIKK